MFSTNPCPQLASPIHVFPPPSSFLDHEKDGLYINHHHRRNNNTFVSDDCFLYSPPPALEKFTTNKQDSVGRLQQQQLIEGSGLEHCDDEYNHWFGSGVSPTKKKKTSKKDHHSKIHTAQGPRDRRVRLSIEVARKFFYLQDLLGLDKASKTLDWLFIKSKIGIDELVEGKKHSSSSTVTDQSEVVFLETSKGGSDEQDKGQKKSAPKFFEGKRKKKYESGFPVNQSRAEARARARERTKEKLYIKKLDDESKKVHGDCCCCPVSPSSLTVQSSLWSAKESQNDYSDRIGESIMEQKISMPSSMLYSYQHNLAVSNDLSSKFTSLPKFTVVHEQQDDTVQRFRSIGEF